VRADGTIPLRQSQKIAAFNNNMKRKKPHSNAAAPQKFPPIAVKT